MLMMESFTPKDERVMGLRRESRVVQERPEQDVEMTSMVDVTFLLLIFFMVTASFSLQKSIELPLRQNHSVDVAEVQQLPEEHNPIRVEIDEAGSFLVISPDWQRETLGKQSLVTTLKEAIEKDRPGMRLVIDVHESARLQTLVDAIDAGTIAGYTQLQIKQVEGFN